jgi:hypothetical protein
LHDLRLLAEADSTGQTLREYVWLDDLPLVVVTNVDTVPKYFYVHADQLNRPIKMTNPSQLVAWDAVYKPFGEGLSITGTQHSMATETSAVITRLEVAWA